MRERRKAKDSRRRVEREEMKKEDMVCDHCAVLLCQAELRRCQSTVSLYCVVRSFADLQMGRFTVHFNASSCTVILLTYRHGPAGVVVYVCCPFS